MLTNFFNKRRPRCIRQWCDRAPSARCRSRTSDWRQVLPVLSEAAARCASCARRTRKRCSNCSRPKRSRGSSRRRRPPSTGFERFIAWAQRERAAGRYICFAVVPDGPTRRSASSRYRQLEPTFATAEWGFAIGRAFWGSGVFIAAARLIVDFAFETVGVHRLEARAAVANGRGNGALAKLGAVREATLRRSFLRSGQYHDQALWSIVRDDWRRAKAVWGSAVH